MITNEARVYRVVAISTRTTKRGTIYQSLDLIDSSGTPRITQVFDPAQWDAAGGIAKAGDYLFIISHNDPLNGYMRVDGIKRATPEQITKFKADFPPVPRVEPEQEPTNDAPDEQERPATDTTPDRPHGNTTDPDNAPAAVKTQWSEYDNLRALALNAAVNSELMRFTVPIETKEQQKQYLDELFQLADLMHEYIRNGRSDEFYKRKREFILNAGI